MIHVPTANIILANIPDEIRAQGVSLNNSIINTFYLMGALLGGGMAQTLGIIIKIMLSGVLLLGLFVTLSIKRYVQRENTLQVNG